MMSYVRQQDGHASRGPICLIYYSFTHSFLLL